MFQKSIVNLILALITFPIFAQNIDFNKPSTVGNLFIRMYGEVHYNQPILTDLRTNGTFDAKRIVALFGYQFDRKTQFVTEWELEHANEIFLEQAFIKHRIGSQMSIKAGMILIPMGLINEFHEPNNYFSVDRPLLDRSLVPSTWRDIGIGLTGLWTGSDIKYQLYLVNGLMSYKDGTAKYKGSNNYRSGRQKGSKTIFSGLPALSGQLEYFGFTNGKIGLSLYMGDSNSDAYQGLDKDDAFAISQADSTTVFTSMLGLHSSFKINKWKVNSQVIFSTNSNVDAYNNFTDNNLGQTQIGSYLEAGRSITKNDKWLGFVRYSYMDFELDKQPGLEYNKGLHHIITTGVNYFAAKGAVFKIDGQYQQIEGNNFYQINSGIGVWF